MKKRIILFISVIFISLCPCFANDIVFDNEYEEDFGSYPFMGKKYVKPADFGEFINSLDFTLNLSNGIDVNVFKEIDDDIVSSPSKLLYPLSIGLLIPNYTFFAMEPELSFYTMNHMWSNGVALPAEIENRTTTTLSFLLNIPAVITFFFENNRLQLKGGLGMLMRFGLKASGVSEGYSEDIENINKWFWNNGRFLYLTTGISWLFDLTGNTKIGPEFNISFPIGSVISGEGIQGLVSTIGLKISL